MVIYQTNLKPKEAKPPSDGVGNAQVQISLEASSRDVNQVEFSIFSL